MFEVRRSDRHGRGLFATHALPPGTLLSTVPAVLVDNDTRLLLEDSTLSGMFVDWDDEGTGALPLGPLALLNHAGEPNCEIAVADDDVLGPNVQLWTLGRVDAGDELTIDYVAGDPERSLWFETTG